MKKDLDKLFSKSIETYYFLLLIVVIIKLLGGNYFEIVYTNKTINMINDFITYWRLENVWYAITLYINVYITLSITCNDNTKRMKKFSIFALFIALILQFLKSNINMPIVFAFLDIIYLFLLSFVYCVKNNIEFSKQNIKNYVLYMIMLLVCQIFTIITRNITLANQKQFEQSFIVGFILNLDYLIIMILIYKLYFKKGGVSLWDLVVFYFSQKLTSLKDSLKKLQTKLQNKNNNKMTKEEKVTNAIFIPLYILWNLFTMLIIVAIAFLNDAFIEAIFITVAFWVNKFAFGKPFHFKSVAICFAFSSFAYYILTRITFKTETSFFIPIFLGVALSYVTSHFIKKNTKLYKGMELSELYKTVTQVEQDRLIIKILKEYYCDRLSDVQIARINNYSIDSIRKKRQNVNKKLRNLR